MAKKRLNIALIGTKFMGKAHSNGFRKLGMFFDLPVQPVMKVLCGRNPDETKAAAEKYGWEEFDTDWKRVAARPDIDIVDVATPGHLHCPMAVEAAKAGKHVICEKPLANTVDEAKEMVAAVKKAGVKHLCGFTYRFAPAVCTIKQMIQKGELGDIYHYRGAYQQDWIMDPEFPINWRLQKKTAGAGALGDIGAHVVDMCRNLVGEIGEVSASLRTFIKQRPVAEGHVAISGKGGGKGVKTARVDVDDAAVMLGHIKGGDTLVTIEATRFAGGRRNAHTFEVYGSKGSVWWDLEQMNVFHYYSFGDRGTLQGFRRIHATDPGHLYTEAWWPSAHIIGYEHLFVHEFYEFFSQFNRKTVTYPTFEDGLACQKVLDAVQRAAKSRQWEKV